MSKKAIKKVVPVEKPAETPIPKLEKQPFAPKRILVIYTCPACKSVYKEYAKDNLVIPEGYLCAKDRVKMARVFS